MAYLSGFGLENFRVFKDYTWFDFAPITILVGPNSSGKSSLIKALLLLKDNYERGLIPVDEENWWLGRQDLLDFSGKNHNLQNEKSIIPYETEAKEIKFCLPYEIYFSPFNQSLYLEFSYKINEKDLSTGIVTKLRTQTEDLFISDAEERYGFLDTQLLKDILQAEKDNTKKKPVEDRDRNIDELNSILLSSVEFTWPALDNLKNTLNTIKLGKTKISYEGGPWPDNFRVLRGLINNKSSENSEEFADSITSFLELESLSPAFNSWSGYVYVPSIKGLPKRYLKFDDDQEVLNRVFKHLGTSRNDDQLNSKRHKHINSFVKKWEKEFGFKKNITWTKDVDLGFTKIQIGDNYLSDVGFGISQLVAVLLANFAFDSNGNPHLLLLEEPEANLHPAFQSKLADMVADSEKTLGHQFIIETHSEYMIRKFQYLVAKGEMKPEDIVIYYFNDPNNIPAGEKQVKKINVLEDGSLSDDFGPGFYDEAANWKLELLKLKKNKARQN